MAERGRGGPAGAAATYAVEGMRSFEEVIRDVGINPRLLTWLVTTEKLPVLRVANAKFLADSTIARLKSILALKDPAGRFHGEWKAPPAPIPPPSGPVRLDRVRSLVDVRRTLCLDPRILIWVLATEGFRVIPLGTTKLLPLEEVARLDAFWKQKDPTGQFRARPERKHKPQKRAGK